MSTPELSADELTLPIKRTDGDTIKERLTGNAYHNILPARYLKKDADGNLAEDQEDLFERVARNTALAEAVYEAEKRDIEITVTPDQVKPEHPRRDELAEEVFGAGTTVDDDAETTLTEHNVNKFAYETIVPKLPEGVREHVENVAGEFQEMMEYLKWLPNSPTLMNAGDELQQLSACFVMSPEDDLTDIHEKAKEAAEVFQSGGGVGYAFWRLRPYGDSVGSTGGIASGPLTFMETFDQLCETIAQGGTRRGAQMAIMRVSHPDVIEFIHSKRKAVSLAHQLKLNDPDDFTYTTFSEALEEARELIDEDGKVPEHLRNAVEGHLSNFNISVGVTDGFMEAMQNGEEYTFINPRTGEAHIASEETKEMYSRYDLGEYVEPGEELSIPAEVLWERIVEGAHENGEPGVIYLDRVNDEHSFPVESTPTGDGSKYEILSTNPCVTGDTKIATADGRGSVPIEEIATAGEDVPVYCRNEDTGDVEIRTGRDPRLTRRNAELVEVRTDGDVKLRCTTDHEIPTRNRGIVEAADLRRGDSLHILPASRLDSTTSPTPASAANHKVECVEPAGRGDVYNITVDEHHNYFAGIDADEDVFINVLNCGEQPLMEYEACNLGHINLSTVADTNTPDWRVWSDHHREEYDTLEDAVDAFLADAIDREEFDHRIEWGTRFLENVVTMSDFPVEKIEETVRNNRKVGLGIMGLAQLYIQLGVAYGSEVANEIARQLMVDINHGSKWASHELAQDRDSFANWEDSKYANPTEYADWFERMTGLDAEEWTDGFPIRNHNTTTIAPTGCVEENSLVSTDEGLVPIKDLDETTAEFEQWNEIEVGVSTDGGTKAATAVYDNGFADVRQIETEGGFSVASTPDHRFRTITDDGEYVWQEAAEFEPGDRILLQRGTFDSGSRATLDTSERQNYHWNSDEQLELPSEMTPELAEFLGYFMGDGYVHEDVGVKLVVESDAEGLDAYLRKLGESVFGVSPTVEDRDTRHVLVFGGRHLPRYFEDNGWKKADGNEGEAAASAFVPDEVLQGNEAVARAFLRGLFETGGTASRKVELSTVSKTLADQVQTLLLALGCVFVRDTLETADRNDHYGDRRRHSVRGANKREDQRFLEEVGFITKSTEFDLTPQSYKNDTYPPAVVDSLRDVSGYDSVSKPVKSRVDQSPINGSVSRKLVRDIEEETGETVRIDGRPLVDFYAATVGSVTEEKAYTKDISVPSNNTYVANGFVTHNTTSMVGNTSGGCEPIYNVAYYKNVSD
ncbi:MAG: ribonucleotide reductase N-terminal alpha domain-containing protein, partial [Halobacteriales archaeon]